MENYYTSVGRNKSTLIAVFLALLILAPIYIASTSNLELNYQENKKYENSQDTNLYRLYFAENDNNGSSDGDGLITTKIPEDGGQATADALDNAVQFSTAKLRSTLDFTTRSLQGSNNYYIPLNLFLRASGPSGSTVDWTVTMKASGSTIGSVTLKFDACNSGIGSSCEDFDYEVFEVSVGSREQFSVSKDGRLEIIIEASMDNCDGGGLFSSCEAEIAWNEIDGDGNRFSSMEVNANAMADSLVLVQREGSELVEGPELEWYPNDIVSERAMQFTFDVKSAFGRYDIAAVELLVRDPNGVYKIREKIQLLPDADIEDTSAGIFGKYIWTYPSGLTSGDYSIELEVSDIQGNTIVIEHETIKMLQWGGSSKSSI